MFDLKPLSREAIPSALGKAMRYRLLNEPLEAESISLDVLEIDRENQEALVTLILALTDQIEHRAGAIQEARDLLSRLPDEYNRAYYAGIICERGAKAHMRRRGPGSGFAAYEWLRDAMEWYEKAEAIRPSGNDDAILRWNSCARMIMNYPELKPAPADTSHPMLE